MKLTEIHVEGFGVWRDLRLDALPGTITVLYGPNEAGKTTLMHFLRSMLYGVTPERRERYLPPRQGGRPGGSLGLLTDDGAFTVGRHVERGDDDRGRVTVTLPDGETQGDRLLREALESVDEPTYCNVFAIGLDEVNELGALEGAEAARWIYRLTSGLDRVSLYDVIQGLRTGRRELLAPAGEPSRLADLLSRRDRLRTRLDELVVDSRRWSKLAVELDEVDAQTAQLEAELRDAERRARRVEVALGLKPLWAERERVAEERRRHEGLPDLGAAPLARLDELASKAEDLQRQRHTVRGQRRELHKETRELGVNEVLRRSCCRLDALAEQQDWLASLERTGAELGEEVERLESRVAAETGRLAKLWRHKPAPEAAPELDDQTLEELKPAIEAVRDAERLVADAKRDLENLLGHQRNFDAQLEGALTSSEKLGLPSSIDEAGQLVALLRRRLKAEQKVDQARRVVAELDEQQSRLIDRQVLPIELFLLLTALFSAAAVVVFWRWIAPDDASWLSAAGLPALLAAGGCWFARYLLEDNQANELDAARQQFDAAERDVKAAVRERDELDDGLPLQEGAAAIRLQHAEKHLEELERMLPVEAERRKASQRTASAEEYFRAAKDELAKAEKEWRLALRSVGLPDETTAAEVEKLAGQYRALAELRDRALAKREEVDRSHREHEKLGKRIVALAEEAGLVRDGGLSAQLEHLLTERRLQQGRIDHRKKLRERSKELREKSRRLAGLAERVESERHALFALAGVGDEPAFRQVVADIEAAAKLDERRDRLSREIAAAIGASGTEADYAELMGRESLPRLDESWARLKAERDSVEKRLRDLAVRRASLEGDRQTLVADTSLEDTRVELDLVEAQLAEAKDRWRERAAVGAMLELIRSDYEEHRQPETLVEASRYLRELTRGRYPRVWTPLAEDVLLVDDADGRSLPVEDLSRGTREQLFLSVRLALVSTFARRGVQLPMVLDDVLVNFDDARARVAARVLSEFARDGHQVLLFTCHDHVRRMFEEVGADVRRLPSRFDEAPEVEAPELEAPAAVAVEAPQESAAAFDEPQPPVVATPAAPLPAFVEAEYAPLEPLVETRRVVEVVEAPVVVERATRPAVEPISAEPERRPERTRAVGPAHEVAYGAAPSEVAYTANGNGAWDGPLNRPRYAYVDRLDSRGPSDGFADRRPAESEVAWQLIDDESTSNWLDEAQDAWAEPTGVV